MSTVYLSAHFHAKAVNNDIYNIATLIPMILYIAVGVVLAFVYTLDKKKVLENVEILKARRDVDKKTDRTGLVY